MSTPSRISGFNVPAIPAQQVPALKIPYLLSTVSLGDRSSLLTLALSTLHADLGSDEEVVQVVTSIFLTAFPEVANAMKATVTPPLDLHALTQDQYFALLSVDGGGAPDPSLFPLGNPAHGSAVMAATPTAAYSAVALLVFAIGRQARESAPTAAAIKRPAALISKFTIPESEQVVLPDREHGPSIKFLEHAFNSFAVYSGIRCQITLSLLGIEAASIHYPPHVDAMMVQFQLMRYAGLTHVGAIKKLVEAHPWTVRVPELEPYYKVYCRDLLVYSGLSSSEQKYHRLLSSQPDFLFLTSDLRPLIAVAGDYLKDVERDFSGYVYGAGAYQTLIDKVRSYQAGYKSTAKLANMAAILGLDDIPELPEPATAPQASGPPAI